MEQRERETLMTYGNKKEIGPDTVKQVSDQLGGRQETQTCEFFKTLWRTWQEQRRRVERSTMWETGSCDREDDGTSGGGCADWLFDTRGMRPREKSTEKRVTVMLKDGGW